MYTHRYDIAKPELLEMTFNSLNVLTLEIVVSNAISVVLSTYTVY